MSGSSSLWRTWFVSARLVRTSSLGQEVMAWSLGTRFVHALPSVPKSISERDLLHDLRELLCMLGRVFFYSCSSSLGTTEGQVA